MSRAARLRQDPRDVCAHDPPCQRRGGNKGMSDWFGSRLSYPQNPAFSLCEESESPTF